jgi:hypothetical protein
MELLRKVIEEVHKSNPAKAQMWNLIPDYAVPLTCCRVTMNRKGEKSGRERDIEREGGNM